VLMSQYWGGLAPCELCLLQRWPWAVAIVISLIVVLVGERAGLAWVALLLGLVFIISVVMAFYQVGVEQQWFAGPAACPGSDGDPICPRIRCPRARSRAGCGSTMPENTARPASMTASSLSYGTGGRATRSAIWPSRKLAISPRSTSWCGRDGCGPPCCIRCGT